MHHFTPRFLRTYRRAISTIPGWFSFEAALMFIAYNQVLRSHGITGDVMEIGVHRGRSAVAIAALRGPAGRFVAVDTFPGADELDPMAAFEHTMRAFYPDMSFCTILQTDSAQLDPTKLGATFSFCHIDGGHSSEQTYLDLRFCTAISLLGGIVAIDDYFNEAFPGVSEGTARFLLDHPHSLQPVALGHNKVLLQKQPTPAELNDGFSQTFPHVPHGITEFWGARTYSFGAPPLSLFFDPKASTPHRLRAAPNVFFRATLGTQASRLTAAPGQRVLLSVAVKNGSSFTFPHGRGSVGISYHLFDGSSNHSLQFENPRRYLVAPLEPGANTTLVLPVLAPRRRGEYRLVIDLVWEGFTWFNDVGNDTLDVGLVVA